MEPIASRLEEFQAWSVPRDGEGGGAFRLACSLSGPAAEQEISAAWPGRVLPREVLGFWRVCREARLFVDVDYGQWGLHVFSPRESASRTSEERLMRASGYYPDDIVLAEFLGDQELLVVSPSANVTSVLIALPLDRRAEWYVAAPSLEDFLRKYLAHMGEKYWEASQG